MTAVLALATPLGTSAFLPSPAGSSSRSVVSSAFLPTESYTRHVISSSSAKETEIPTTEGADESNDGVPLMTPDFAAAAEATLSAVKASVESPSLIAPLSHFINEYFTASSNAAEASPDSGITPKSTADNMMEALQYGMQHGMVDKYMFGVTHKALRGKNPEEEDGNTIDYYKFGCDFFRPVMDLENSLVLGEENIKTIQSQLDAGENVVFFANHQSEADPQVVSCLFEKVDQGKMGEDMTYVAGHKVTTDVLAIPFSMGRNLICIHSKKHLDADPDTKKIKSKQNLAAMSGMLQKLKKGGTAIWVAPSGGRDRRNVDDGTVPLAPFDQKTIDMFRLMGNKSKVPTHYYAMSMVSYDLCPPPDFVEAGVGEQRNVRFVPIGINVSKELENVGGVETRHLFTDEALKVCQEGYDELLEKMAAKQQ